MLHVITCLFNPADSVRIRENYHTFRKHLGDVPVTTVELVLPGQSRITDVYDPLAHAIFGDRLRHALWQKERLLNIALKLLPPEATAVAWIDADVVFARPDWSEATMDALTKNPVCQLWSAGHWLDPLDCIERSLESIASKVNRQSPHWGHPGFAWAARRDFLEEVGGFFDVDPIGGGDTWMMWAFLDRMRDDSSMKSSPELTAAWRRWSEPVKQRTQGAIGLVPGDVYHLYHGDYSTRQYIERTQAKADFNFRPGIDTTIDELGLYAWTGANPGLEAFVRNYFPSRKDDGNDRHAQLREQSHANAH